MNVNDCDRNTFSEEEGSASDVRQLEDLLPDGSAEECTYDKENIDFSIPRLICRESASLNRGIRMKRRLEKAESFPPFKSIRSGIADPLFTRVINVRVKDSKEFVSPSKVNAIIKYTFPW